MPLKDYYKILEVPPDATVSDIKKSFRRLALRFHPDTNHGNRYAEAWYREIQEAYETLTDEMLREEYLQQRWLLKSQGKPFSETVPLTPPFILKHVVELLERVRNIDHFRMDHQALQQQILLAVDDERIDVLNTYNDDSINIQVIHTIKDCLFPLEYQRIKPIVKQLYKITTDDPRAIRIAKQYLINRRRDFFWERYQALIILFITIILCLIIYLAAKESRPGSLSLLTNKAQRVVATEAVIHKTV